MPRPRRILSLWFPRMAAERVLRGERGTMTAPFAVVATEGNMQTLASLGAEASAAGLRVGQPLRDARAFCPELVTRPENPPAEAAFLARLRRWAGRFSPFVAAEPPAALMLDITGCAHLFGGEAALAGRVRDDCAALGLSVRTGIADTPGAAWALARFAGEGAAPVRSGDAIDQEARATRSRAARRHWTRGGRLPVPMPTPTPTPAAAPAIAAPAIAAPGGTRAAVGPLPVAALRLSAGAAEGLARLGIRRIDELCTLPRAALARRFGRDVVQRLDQALGVEPEPISPAPPDPVFAARLSLPEPIGRESDVLAALERLLVALCARLERHGRGARRIRLEAMRADHTSQRIEAGLARPARTPERIRPLVALKIGDIDPGHGIDVLRLSAPVTEPLHTSRHAGHAEAFSAAERRRAQQDTMGDLVTRLGARIGLEAVTRLDPADSHIPEKTATVMGAAWAGAAAAGWPAPARPRPLVLFSPEIVSAPGNPAPPRRFRWRRRVFAALAVEGPERIAPEWWLDDPAWRSGPRDYWCITTRTGERLWLFFAHGGGLSGGWFCHGIFA